MVTIKVILEKSGEPVKGKKVSLGFDGLLRGVTSSEYTDSNGEAHFDVKPGDGKVYVGGTSKFHGRLAGRVYVYI